MESVREYGVAKRQQLRHQPLTSGNATCVPIEFGSGWWPRTGNEAIDVRIAGEARPKAIRFKQLSALSYRLDELL
jgi:hypothetical protein